MTSVVYTQEALIKLGCWISQLLLIVLAVLIPVPTLSLHHPTLNLQPFSVNKMTPHGITD